MPSLSTLLASVARLLLQGRGNFIGSWQLWRYSASAIQLPRFNLFSLIIIDVCMYDVNSFLRFFEKFLYLVKLLILLHYKVSEFDEPFLSFF